LSAAGVDCATPIWPLNPALAKRKVIRVEPS
jgi:hypothetical protein